jgi:LmbE family N-acetylglucosaminyl deacetylase
MKVLCIGAHPDDAETGPGGTLAKHADKGDDVNVLICTLGGVHGNPADRMEEAQTGASILGIKSDKLRFLDYPVSRLNNPSPDFTATLEKTIEDVNPDRIYCHSPFDYHQVHVTIGKTMGELARKESLKQVIFYEVISSTSRDFIPNAFVDITNYVELKVKSILAHESQAMRIYTQPNVVRALCNIRYAREKVGANPNGMAEAFTIHKYVV